MGRMGPVVDGQEHEGWVVPLFADGAQGAGTSSARGRLIARRPDDGPCNGDRVRLTYDKGPFSTHGLLVEVLGGVTSYHSTWRYSYIKNDELDKLIDEGKMEMDLKKREDIYKRASVLFRELAPVVFLYGGVSYFATSAKVKNFHPRGDARFFFYNVSFNK